MWFDFTKCVKKVRLWSGERLYLCGSGPTPEGAPTSRVRVDAGDSSAQRRHWAGRRPVSHAAHACGMALCLA